MSFNQDQKLTQRLVAVVVTYNPDAQKLLALLKIIVSEVFRVVIVDNGSANLHTISSTASQFDNIQLIPLFENKGIGFAQNVAIRVAEACKSSHIITFDQDSHPDPGMIAELQSVFYRNNISNNLAAVGPVLYDEESGIAFPFFQFSKGRKHRIWLSEKADLTEVEFLVSSGTLISMDAIRQVGMMNEDLFISYVDVEWCLRAKSKDFSIMVAPSACMKHNLGDQQIRIGRWLLPLHSPLRHFYLMRSGVYMQKLPHVHKDWKRADRLQLLRSFFIFSIIGLPRFTEISYMVRGFIEGLRLPVSTAPNLS